MGIMDYARGFVWLEPQVSFNKVGDSEKEAIQHDFITFDWIELTLHLFITESARTSHKPSEKKTSFFKLKLLRL